MNRWSRINLLLLVVVATLGAFGYYGSARKDIEPHALSSQPPDRARVIRIVRGDSPDIVINKEEGGWRLAAPLFAEADVGQVQRLLAILAARPTQRLEAVELERFGLDRPRSRLMIDDEIFTFGAINPVLGEQYVLSRGTVYSVAAHLGNALPRNAMQLARKQMLSRTELPTRFELDEFSMWLQDGKWILSPPHEPLTQDDLARWAESWRRMTALRVAPLAPGTASAEIRIALKSGKSIALAVVQRTPELVLARHDEKLQYHFPAATARRLFAPPKSAPSARDDTK